MLRPAALPLWGLTVALLVLAPTLAGCGACQQVSARRDAFLTAQQQGPSDDRAHLVLEIPDGMLQQAMEQAVARAPKVGIQPPGLGDLSRYAGDLDVSTRRMRLSLSTQDKARFDLDLDVGRKGRQLFGMALQAAAPVRFDPATRSMRISLRADMFQTVAPRIDSRAADRLADALLGDLPAIARTLFPRDVVLRLTQQAVTALGQQAYALLRQRLLTPLGELASLEFQLPDLPITALAVEAAPGGWRLEARSSLPARGLQVTGPVQVAPQRLRFLLSADALAALGNRAMARGDLPARYDSAGKADPQGDFVAGLGWQPGARPLQAHLWRAQAASPTPQAGAKPKAGLPNLDGGLCVYVRAAAIPEVALEGSALRVGFKDGQIEEVLGPPLLKEALDVLGVSRKVFEYGRTVALGTRLSFGAGPLQVGVTKASVDPQALVLELSTQPATAAPAAPARPRRSHLAAPPALPYSAVAVAPVCSAR